MRLITKRTVGGLLDMNSNQILEHLRREPFQPIRICMSDGSSYEVRHPEMALVTRREVVIALPPQEAKLPERSVFCDPLHVTRIELIDRTKRNRKSTKPNK